MVAAEDDPLFCPRFVPGADRNVSACVERDGVDFNLHSASCLVLNAPSPKIKNRSAIKLNGYFKSEEISVREVFSPRAHRTDIGSAQGTLGSPYPGCRLG